MKNKKLKKLLSSLLVLAVLLLLSVAFDRLSGQSVSDLTGGDAAQSVQALISPEIGEDHQAPAQDEAAPDISEDGEYTARDDVALYIHTYGHLSSNFVTKKEAQKAGWSGGSLENYLPGKSIGGDRFGNREGLLPDEAGRTWTECDINTMGADSRGAERIVFSNDGLIYYTEDHYESFMLLYG